MKKLVWIAGVVLALSFVFPNGVTINLPTPVVPVDPTPAPVGNKDPKIAALLRGASAKDRASVRGIYTGAADVLRRDGGKQMRTTEHWANYQARALNFAVDGTDLKGKYPGLDVAIDEVFARLVGTKDVVAVDAVMLQKLIEACETVANSAK